MEVEFNEIKKYVDGYVKYKQAYQDLRNAIILFDQQIHNGRGYRSKSAADFISAFLAGTKFIIENADKEQEK